jgi:hypothetical protein
MDAAFARVHAEFAHIHAIVAKPLKWFPKPLIQVQFLMGVPTATLVSVERTPTARRFAPFRFPGTKMPGVHLTSVSAVLYVADWQGIMQPIPSRDASAVRLPIPGSGSRENLKYEQPPE